MSTKTRKHQLAAYQRRCIFKQLSKRAVKMRYTRVSLSSFFLFLVQIPVHSDSEFVHSVSVLVYTDGWSDSLAMNFFQHFFFLTDISCVNQAITVY